jgi:hypothetical protein
LHPLEQQTFHGAPGHVHRIIVFGQRHLAHLVREYVRYYHECRPHQSLGNAPITPATSEPVEGEIVWEERLGGVLKHYYRRVA